MNQLHKNILTKSYQNRELVLDAPMNQWCYFIFTNKSETIGYVYAKLIDDELARNLIADDDTFHFLLPKNVWFEYRYDNIDNGTYVCYVEIGE